MKILSNTPNRDRLGLHSSHFFPRFDRMDFLFVTFFFDGGFGLAFRFFCFTLTFLKRFDTILYIIFSVFRKSILHRLKYRDFVNIISQKFDQIGYPKTSFPHFRKYGENKESHVFTIDNTIVIKNIHNS